MDINLTYNDKEIETLGVAKSKSFGFSKNASEILFSVFTKNIYSNPIGSVVREITSNCFDSHKEANVNDAVIVKLTNENNQHYISFIDVGVGMSTDRINNVYSQYFESSKRNDNNQIGGFGIGGKTPLAYSESFFLITIFDGIKYTYSIRKGHDSPVLDLLDKGKTKEHNGTTIKIPIKTNDIGVFEKEINRQLYYFENVIFEGFSQNVKNDYRILQGKSFLYRGNAIESTHICLGRVAYPIDFSVLGDEDDDSFHSSYWDVPVAIKMEIGEINVTVSREAIDYTETSKKLIKKKLLEVKAEMLAMLEKQHSTLDSLEDYYRLQENSSLLFVSKEDTLNISSFREYRNVTVKKFNAIDVPSQFEIIDMFYNISLFGKKTRRDRTWDKSLKNITNERVFFVTPLDDMPRKKNAYMKNTHKHFFTLRRSEFTLTELKALVKKITPEKSTADNKTIFKQFRELQKEVFQLVEGKVKTYASVTVPDGFTVSSGRTYDPNYELPVTFDQKYGFDKDRLKMSTLENSKATLYYGDLDDHSMMVMYSDYYRALFQPESHSKFNLCNWDSTAYPIRFVMVSKSNLKYITQLKNAKPYKEFHKVLLRKKDAVAKQIEKNMFNERYQALSELFLNEALFNVVDKTYAKKVGKLVDLKKKYAGFKHYSINTDSVATFMGVDKAKIDYTGHDLFSTVETTTEKNGMLKFVRVSNNFNPNAENGYNKKEIGDIVKLLKMAYVK